MRGTDSKQEGMFSYVSSESRIPPNHPLRPIRAMVAEALVHLDRKLERLYSKTGRPSIACAGRSCAATRWSSPPCSPLPGTTSCACAICSRRRLVEAPDSMCERTPELTHHQATIVQREPTKSLNESDRATGCLNTVLGAFIGGDGLVALRFSSAC